jgi:hypothetical protein
VSFGDRHLLASGLQAGLRSIEPPVDTYVADQMIQLLPLGDIDGDGYADVSLTTRFEYQAYDSHRAEPCFAPSNGCDYVTTFRNAAVTYLFYGGPDRLDLDGSPAAPAARFPGVNELHSIGDVNGDGYADMAAATETRDSGQSREAYLVPGGARRLEGELPLSEVGTAMAVDGTLGETLGVGDLDADGYADFVVASYQGGTFGVIGDEVAYLFYGGAERAGEPIRTQAADAVLVLPGSLAFLDRLGDWDGDGFDTTRIFDFSGR